MVNWLGTATTKLDKCLFSTAADGLLRVLDEADAQGYEVLLLLYNATNSMTTIHKFYSL
jgi:hypothetical protein